MKGCGRVHGVQGVKVEVRGCEEVRGCSGRALVRDPTWFGVGGEQTGWGQFGADVEGAGREGAAGGGAHSLLLELFEIDAFVKVDVVELDLSL